MYVNYSKKYVAINHYRERIDFLITCEMEKLTVFQKILFYVKNSPKLFFSSQSVNNS